MPPFSAYSRRTLHVTAFLTNATYTAAAPTLWAYVRLLGGNQDALAAFVAVHAAGELVGAAVAISCVVHTVPLRVALRSAAALGVVGSAVLFRVGMTPPVMSVHAPMSVQVVIIVTTFARALLGIWSGAVGVLESAYVSTCVPGLARDFGGSATRGAVSGAVAAVAVASFPNAPPLFACVSCVTSFALYTCLLADENDHRSPSHVMEDCTYFDSGDVVDDEESAGVSFEFGDRFSRNSTTAASTICAACLVSLLYVFAMYETVTR